MAVFGREMRDGLPVLPGKYNPHTCWKELLDYREKGLAKRHVAMKEAWTEHTTKLTPLKVGDKVFLQNQRGNNPRRWERTGIILETKPHDQYLVKVDGTGRTTLRNRKFLRKYQPIAKPSPTPPSQPSVPITGLRPEYVPYCLPTPAQSTFPAPEHPSTPTEEIPPNLPQQDVYTPPTQAPPNDHNFYHDENNYGPDTAHTYPSVQDEAPNLPEHPAHPPPAHNSAPASSPPTCASPPATRPRRASKPSCKLDPNVWDLSSLSQYDTDMKEMCLGLIKWMAANAERLFQSPLDKKTPEGEGDKGY